MGRRSVVTATNATIVGCIETTTRSNMRGSGCGPGKPALTAKRGSLALGEDDTVLPTAHRGAEPMGYLGCSPRNSASAFATSSRAAFSARRCWVTAMERAARVARAPTGTLISTNRPGVSGRTNLKTPNRNSSGLIGTRRGTPSLVMLIACGPCRAARMRSSEAEDGSDCCARTGMTLATSAMMTTITVRAAFSATCDIGAVIVISGQEEREVNSRLRRSRRRRGSAAPGRLEHAIRVLFAPVHGIGYSREKAFACCSLSGKLCCGDSSRWPD
jgi:hypothetical protein